MRERFWLITGADGMIGRRVCAALAASGERFLGTIRPGASAPPSQPEGCFRDIDLCQVEESKRLVTDVAPSHLVNLAAVGVYPSRRESTESISDINVRLPGVLYEASPSDCTFVQVGSMSQYRGDTTPLHEDTAVRVDSTPYAWSKNAAESLLAVLSSVQEKRRTLVRLFGVVSPDEPSDRLLPHIVANCLRDTPVPLSDGAQVRDMLHVDDAAKAILAVARSTEFHGMGVNIGRGTGVSIRWVAERAAHRLGKEALLRFGAIPRRRGEPECLIADIGRLAATGFKPSLSMEATVDATIDALVLRMNQKASAA